MWPMVGQWLHFSRESELVGSPRSASAGALAVEALHRECALGGRCGAPPGGRGTASSAPHSTPHTTLKLTQLKGKELLQMMHLTCSNL